MKEIVFDIEANGLKPDKIWCIVAKPLGQPVVSFGEQDQRRYRVFKIC